MINCLKFTVPALLFSSLIFYFLYKKIDIVKLTGNKRNRKIGAFIVTFILSIVAISITDSFSTTKGYHDFFSGLFMGPMIGFIAITAPDNNSKTKS